MTRQQAAQVVAILTAGFPNDVLEAVSVDLYVQELALLQDPVVGIEAARVVVREGDRFPSLKAFRQVYHSLNARRREQIPKLPEPSLPSTRPPDWVQVWWWTRMTTDHKDWRPFPQQDGADFAPDVLSLSEFEGLRDAWQTAGSPSIRSARDLVSSL